MSSAATTKPQSFLGRNHLLLRRLHSLTGIVPIGVFLIAHLVTNSSILWGKVGMRQAGHDMTMVQGGVTYFQKEVQWINEQVPHLLLIEITLWTALAYHSILGFYYARTGRTNVAAYAYQSNWRYTLQRISGYFGILFIIYHIGTLRWGWSFLTPGGTTWSHEFAASTMALALRGGEDFTAAGIAVSLFYLVSVSLLVFHFANGLWTAAITWGLTISQTAQKRWGYACAGLGAGLMLAAWSAVVGFATLSPDQAKQFELEYHKKYGGPALVEKVSKPMPAPSTGSTRESVPVQGQ